MNVNKIFSTLFCGALCFVIVVPAFSQEPFAEYRKKKQGEFEAYRNKKRKEFEEYRRKKNLEFAQYVAQKWEEFNVYRGAPALKIPEPVEPIVCPYDDEPLRPTPKPLPIGEVKPVPIPIKQEPLQLPTLPQDNTAKNKALIVLFGTTCKVEMTDAMKFKLKNVEEKEVSRVIGLMASEKYTPLFNDCARVYSELQLNGWATMKFCEAVARKMFGKSDEAMVMQSHLMTQLGYDARLCSNGKRLYVMCTAAEEICEYYYLTVDKKKYYVWDESYEGGSVYTYRKNVKDATRMIDFDNASSMRLAYVATPVKKYASERYPKVTANVSVNKNLMDYYASSPRFLGLSWGVYARQKMERNTANQLVPALRLAISGKSEVEAANMLINFVQTGFKYATDDEQFGYEKPFFKEELFYYPYCDCEDRSILFSSLVKELLGLDAVLLYAPGHLWTAVRFNVDVPGDYIVVNGAKYTICDPTYIGAPIGRCMDQYKNVKPDVVRF